MAPSTRYVPEATILEVVVGSRAHGLHTEASDTDIRGIFVVPTPHFWSLTPPPTHEDGPLPEQFSWEAARFCDLALAGNPAVLEVLFSPLVRRCAPAGEELRAMRGAFVSRRVHGTYSRYGQSQARKMAADLRRDGDPRWKHAMHLVRLLLQAEHLLRTGDLVLDAGPHRERLLAVRSGQVEWDDVEAWLWDLHTRLDDALEVSPLPAEPDVGAVEGWLRSVRERSAREALA